MRIPCIIGLTLLLFGCSTGRQEYAALTAEEAGTIAAQLANDKATVLYHCQPFTGRRAAQFSQGRWVWSDRQGFNQGDLEATAEIAANGATNSVVILLLDNRTPSRRF